MTAQLQVTAPEGQDLSPWRQPDALVRRRRRRMLLSVAVAFTLFVTLAGVPTGREWLTFWILVALLAAVGGDVGLWRRVVVRDWLPLLAVLVAYDLLRGVANEIGGSVFNLASWRSDPNNVVSAQRAHLLEPLRADELIFNGRVPTEWLQQHFYNPGTVHWWDRIAITIYLSHFLVSLILAIVLWCVNYSLFRRYLGALVALTLITLVTYVAYPAAPPWMAALNGHLSHVARVVPATLSLLGGETVDATVEKGAAYSNQVAAMPSLHAAIPMMMLLFFWGRVRWWLKGVLALYAAGMALTLVYTGEHYVIDVLAGWLYAAASVAAVNAFLRFRAPVAAREDWLDG